MSCVQPSWSVEHTSLQCAPRALWERTMRQIKKARIALAMAITTTLAACAVGPDYQRPDVSAPDAFVGVPEAQFNGAEVDREFWKTFDDSQLNRLIEEALEAN